MQSWKLNNFLERSGPLQVRNGTALPLPFSCVWKNTDVVSVLLTTQRDDTRYNICNLPHVRLGVGRILLQHSDVLQVE